VVFVATIHASVCAFDADDISTSPVWYTSIFTYSSAGATAVPAIVKKDAGTSGWTELAIVSAPVIDPGNGTPYLVAETYEKLAVRSPSPRNRHYEWSGKAWRANTIAAM
jgi:hypothetical protein